MILIGRKLDQMVLKRSVLFSFEGTITFRKCGEYSEEVPPVPIPNTVVKLLCTDDTWGVTPWEIRTSPRFLFAKITENANHAADGNCPGHFVFQFEQKYLHKNLTIINIFGTKW